MLHYFRIHYYSSALIIQGSIKGSILQWEDPEYTAFDSQSTNQIIAEIDFEVNSESHLNISVGEDDDSNHEANLAQCFSTPDTVSATDKEAHSLTHMPLQATVDFLSES